MSDPFVLGRLVDAVAQEHGDHRSASVAVLRLLAPCIDAGKLQAVLDFEPQGRQPSLVTSEHVRAVLREVVELAK